MAKKKKVVKAKEPIRIRFKELSNGNKSIYLDVYRDGKRTYEFLKLYLVPETNAASKAQNQNTLQAANAIKAQRMIDLTNNKAGIKPIGKSKILLLDWIKTFQKAQKERGIKSLQNYDSLIILLNDFKGKGIEGVMLKDVDKSFCIEFINHVSKVYVSSRTKNHLLSSSACKVCDTLNRTLNAAVKEELIARNPFSLIETADKIKVDVKQREYLTIDELKMLIATPCKNDMVKRAYLFSCYCGLRLSDVNALTWGNIINDMGHYRLEIIMQKTKTPVYIPLSDVAIKWLPERNDASDTDNVFNLLAAPNVERHLAVWANAAGITKHITFHTSRHTFATMMLALGADLYTTSKLLGHSNIATTQIYAKVIDSKKDEAVNLVNGIF